MSISLKFKRPLTATGLAVGAIALVAGGVAWAASLTVSSATLGAGSTTVAACQTSGTISGTYTTADTGTGYKITMVTVSGVDATDCNGKTLSVTVSDGTNSNLGSASTPVVTGTTSYPISLTPSVLESAATHLDIEIK